jgi:AcrR family transcriptional regulator
MGIQERKERERERRRQQIMVAARRVFSAKGLNKSTMEDIAKEAELSPGTLYLYFRNKDELFASLSLRMLQFLNLRLEELEKNQTLTVEKQFHILKQGLYDVYDFDPLVLINMFHLQSSETLRNLSPELIQEIKALSRKALRSMAHVFEEGIREKRFIRRHPTAMADSLWALFSGIVLWEESKKIIDDDKDYLKPTLDLAFEIFWRGICA